MTASSSSSSPTTSKAAERLQPLLDAAIDSARSICGRNDAGHVVVSPYRFNPLGAHVDHQGGAVMARTIDQYTLLPFWPNPAGAKISLQTPKIWNQNQAEFTAGEMTATDNWLRYAQAAAAVLSAEYESTRGYQGFVTGTLIGAGLSSSASVVLAYLSAMVKSSGLSGTSAELVEWSRRVENDFLGLNNGIQDQMSVVYGQANALSLLDNRNATASSVDDPATVNDICWVVCYSGISRELINSGFNNRVAECREAARLLDANAEILGQVKLGLDDKALQALPENLANRARHFFTEIERVAQGCDAWRSGDFQAFGELMNLSCHSSITQYESGSQPLIDLHEIASATSGVLGSRFSGGGYGGCVVALTDRRYRDTAADAILENYRQLYPEHDTARTFIAHSESGVRVLPMQASA